MILFIELRQGPAYIALMQGRDGRREFETGEGSGPRPRQSRRGAMTQEFNHVEDQSSRFNEFVGSALTGLMVVLFGVVSIVSVLSLVHV
jgi:hypothetical protein